MGLTVNVIPQPAAGTVPTCLAWFRKTLTFGNVSPPAFANPLGGRLGSMTRHIASVICFSAI